MAKTTEIITATITYIHDEDVSACAQTNVYKRLNETVLKHILDADDVTIEKIQAFVTEEGATNA